MNSLTLHVHTTVAEVLDCWPETAAVFNHYRTACLGCVMSPFCTLGDVAAIYHVDMDRLLAELQSAVAEQEDGE